MPELPEVETVRRELDKLVRGRRIIRARTFRGGLRQPFPPELESVLSGYRISAIRRRAKYLLIEDSGGRPDLVIHLGMSGKINTFDSGRWSGPGKHDHFMFETDNGLYAVLNDPRRFGNLFLTPDSAKHPALASLGPEPLDDSFTGGALMRALGRSRRPLKNSLMDQRIVAGLGNIYVCEALFESGLSPFRESCTLTPDESQRLADAIKDVLLRAIKAGGSTLRDYARPGGESGYFQLDFAVYGKEGQRCPDCSRSPDNTCGRIQRVVQGGRPTFFCRERQN